jgi:MYXO-CTERM domain-containing protein
MPRRALALLSLLVLFLVTSLAQAMGSFRLKSTELTEVSGAWHVFVSIDLPSAPALPHVPVKFMFTKTVVYERADFADGTGKIFKGTRFDFGITRQRGFEAGEYKLQLRMSDGTDIGTPVTLILKGDNPVVDRRSIAFNANDKGIKKVDTGLDAGAKVAQNDTSAAPTSTDVAAVGSAPPFIDPSAFNKTDEETVKTRPSGCGCSVPGLGNATNLVGVALPLLGLSLLVARRRRSQNQDA